MLSWIEHNIFITSGPGCLLRKPDAKPRLGPVNRQLHRKSTQGPYNLYVYESKIESRVRVMVKQNRFKSI